MEKSGSRTSVGWNPWAELTATLPDMGEGDWQRMTCVEVANAADDAVTLQPNEAHSMEARVRVEALAP